MSPSKKILKTLIVGAFVISTAGFAGQASASFKPVPRVIATTDVKAAVTADKSGTKVAMPIDRRPRDRRCRDRHRRCGPA